MLLAVFDREPGRLGRAFVTFGRVPLFYYVLHIFVISLSSRVFYAVCFGQDFQAMSDGLGLLFTGQALPEWYGRPLWVVYVSWILIVLALYAPCAWYARIKARSRSPLFSYL